MVEPTYQAMTVADGLALHVADYAAVAAPLGQGGLSPTPLGVPVVCLHGLTRNSRDFEDLAPFIANLGRRVLALDMRGRGRSGYAADPASYQPAVYADDVNLVLDALGVGRAVFVGTSMGGLITMVLNALRPGRVAAAVLNDVGPELDPAGLARIAGYVGKLDGAFSSWEEAGRAIEAINGAAFPGRDSAFWQVFAKRTCRQTENGIVLDYDGRIAQAFSPPPGAAPAVLPDLWPLFDTLVGAGPVLVVRGGLSDLLAPATLARMVAAAPSVQALEVAGVGHAPTLSEPEALLAICDFLARVD